jgi:hypothetical protein
MGDDAMRAIFLYAGLLMQLSLGASLAQDQKSAAPNALQPAQSQPDSRTSTTGSSSNNGQKDRVMERTGPGIDWDHRKPGRDWKFAPGNGEAGRN